MNNEDKKFDINEHLFNKYPEQFSAYLRGRVIETPPGWDQLVVSYVDLVVSLFPKIRFTQIKEKFGTLRVYFSGDFSENVWKLINNITSTYETITEYTCADCGSAEGVELDSTRWRTYRCPTHSHRSTVENKDGGQDGQV